MIMRNLFTDIILGFILFFVSALLTRFMMQRVRVVDIPNDRSSHSIPVPRCGGMAIVGSFYVGILARALLLPGDPGAYWHFGGFVLATLLIVSIAVYDDIKSKSPLVKLLTQCVAAGILLVFGICLDRLEIPFAGTLSLGWLAYPFTFFWVIGMTNAFNFMDGLDGLAGGTAVIASAFFCVITYSQDGHFVSVASLCLMAGTLGFLIYNFPPARIFMGDVGSTFLGFSFAALSIMAVRNDPSSMTFWVMPLLLFNFIYDTFFTFLRRLFNAERVTQAHRTHLYQLFQRLGFSHKAVGFFHYGVCVAQGFAAVWMVGQTADARWLAYLPFLLFQIIYTVIIIRASKRKGLI